ncbi:ferritin [Candidatus Fermentibacteria bacterium]|nr:MAG: ferritin [Candidatus Fermentibacteria bacterium]
MLSVKMEKAINEQINKELFSSYLYMAMSMYFEDGELSGAASWMRVQAQEELSHADKLMKYVNERGGRVVLEALEKPRTAWDTPLEACKEVLEHERFISASINNLVQLAREENDFMTDNFLQWYVSEQVEEEASAADVVRMFSLAGNAGGGLLMIDRELGSRVFNPPAAD